MIFSSKVPGRFHGECLINYLVCRFTYRNKSEWQNEIGRQRITVNGAVVPPDSPIWTGDVVACDFKGCREPDADLDFAIVYEDDWLLGINKPGNLLTHRRGKSIRNNLISLLRYEHSPAYPQAHLINRLDRETSGIVLVAKNKKALTAMQALFNESLVQKTYLAVVRGIPAAARGTVDLKIARDKDSAIPSRRHVTDTGGKAASTRYELVQVLGRSKSLLRLVPHTGRTHQLRVHLQAIGHPILGDKMYGRPEQEYLRWLENPGLLRDSLYPRQALHCSATAFMHPFTGRLCRIAASPPGDFNMMMAAG